MHKRPEKCSSATHKPLLTSICGRRRSTHRMPRGLSQPIKPTQTDHLPSSSTASPSSPLCDGRDRPSHRPALSLSTSSSLDRMETVDISCRFVKRGCTHRDLFHAKYQRANRSHGTKILRCFPHCCPQHVARSYCGRTLELSVEGASFDAGMLQVFSRFRPSDDRQVQLRVGDTIPLNRIMRSLQSETNTKAEWIPSQLSPTGTNDRLFVINPNGRWYYEWCSGKLSAKRFTKHLLESFVFKQEDEGATLRVIATTRSSDFTLVSFRRVTTEPVFPTENDSGACSDDQEVEVAPKQLMAVPKPDRAISTRPSSPVHTHTLSFPQQLEVVFTFAKRLPVDAVRAMIPTWSDLETVGLRDISIAQQLVSAFNPLQASDIAGQLVWWISLDDMVAHEWKRCTQHASRVLLDREALWQCYERWMQWLSGRVDAFLSDFNGLSLAHLTHELPPVSVQMNSPHPFDWRSFIARAREAAIHKSDHTPILQVLGVQSFQRNRTALWRCPFHRINIAYIDPKCLNRDEMLRESLGQTSFVSLLAFWQQLSHLQIDFKGSQELCLSAVSTDGEPRDGLRLLLDNKYRWFNTLPNGDSTLTSSSMSHAFGDYIGSISENGDVEITCFSWATHATYPKEDTNHGQVAYKWHWGFRRGEIDSKRLDVHVTVSFGVLQTSVRDYQTKTAVNVAYTCFREKLAMVGTWREQFRAHLPYSRA